MNKITIPLVLTTIAVVVLMIIYTTRKCCCDKKVEHLKGFNKLYKIERMEMVTDQIDSAKHTVADKLDDLSEQIRPE